MSAAATYRVPLVLLGLMLVLMLASSWNDSAIIDELAHIPAGYSYVYLRDYRLNPEHPPLIKDLAALPLAFSNVHFPTDVQSWRDDINGQWTQGAIFLYESGNDPDSILRLMRLPMMLLAVLFGWLIWRWTESRFGRASAHLTLFFYALSPTFIAHSRFVTTDLAAAFGFFIGLAAFLNFLERPTPRNILIAGLAFGAAQLLKFSLILLVPVYGILLVAWAVSRTEFPWRERLTVFLRLAAKTMAIALVAVALIWVVYAYHVWNYPAERQSADAEFLLGSFGWRPAAAFDHWLNQGGITRPLGQYLLGLLMVLQRAAGGNTQYFLGEVSAAGDWRYFPILYLLKEPLAFHILSAVGLFFALRRVLGARRKSLSVLLTWMRDNFAVASALVFIAVYWLSSVTSPLNIGVRHVLPTFPFIYALVSREVVAWLRSWPAGAVETWWEALKRLFHIFIAPLPRYLFVGVLLLWMAAGMLAAFPFYLSYYNELAPLAVRAVRAGAAGGSLPLVGRGSVDTGYLIAVDSNYDWGQDLRRLAEFVEANGIQTIAVDYFGGGSPRHYLGDPPAGGFEPWWSAKGYPPEGGWFAVSATFQMGAYGAPVKGFIRRPEDSYAWLKPFRPVARAGKSIFIYHLPKR